MQKVEVKNSTGETVVKQRMSVVPSKWKVKSVFSKLKVEGVHGFYKCCVIRPTKLIVF